MTFLELLQLTGRGPVSLKQLAMLSVDWGWRCLVRWMFWLISVAEVSVWTIELLS